MVVQHRGLYYQLDVFDSKRQLLMPQALQKQLDFIVADADHAAGRLYANIDLGMFGTFI